MANSSSIINKEQVKASKWYFLAFLEGALVIFSELIGAKMLGSFYGTSLMVWSAVISVTITFLTIGYFIGGKFSKKPTKINTLRICFALAALLLIIMPSWSTILFVNFSGENLILDTIKSSVLLIGPSVFCIGVSSPIIIQILSEINHKTGDVSGKVYALSTLAGIISTLILGYVFLPNFGLKTPLFIGSLLLILVSLLIKISTLNIFISLIVVIIGLFSLSAPQNEIKFYKTLYESEGLMGQIKVMDNDYKANDVHFRILFVNGVPQTIIYNDGKKSNSFWQYIHKIAAVASMKKNKEALLLGMGGGTIASELQLLNMRLDIVDIDKRMNEIAQNYFYYKPVLTTTFTTDDGRHFLKKEAKKYDLIVIDVLSGEVQPSNIFTMEGINDIKKRIKKDGILLIQYQEKINPAKISGSQSIAKTLLKNNFKVYQNIEYDGGGVSGIILACSLSDISFDKLKLENCTKNVKENKEMKEFFKVLFTPIKKVKKNSVLLVDDKPMLELINAETIENWRKFALEYYGIKFLKK